MRSLIIPDCSYEKFEYIRSEILATQAHGLISCDYLREEKKAYFRFWDSQYIPEVLLEYAGNDQRDSRTTLDRLGEFA